MIDDDFDLEPDEDRFPDNGGIAPEHGTHLTIDTLEEPDDHDA